MLADRIGGIISVLFGAIAISEAMRLYPRRTDTLVGDHIFPGVVGGGLILLGLIFIFFIKKEQFQVEFSNRKQMAKLLLTLGLLFTYWFILPYLGYAIGTLLVSIGLFKVIGSFNFLKSMISAVVLTVVFYLIFIYWLTMPLPDGILNF